MKTKTYQCQEITRDKSISRKIVLESRVKDDSKELLIQIHDKGEHDAVVSCLIVDIIEMKKIRQVLNHCIGDR